MWNRHVGGKSFCFRKFSEIRDALAPYFGASEKSSKKYKPYVWRHTPRNILLVKRHGDLSAVRISNEIMNVLNAKYPKLQFYIEPESKSDFPSLPVYTTLISNESFDATESARLDDDVLDPCLDLMPENIRLPLSWQSKIDLVLSIGSDGTLLYSSFLFPRQAPPCIAFFITKHVGFLSPHSVDIESIDLLLSRVFSNSCNYLTRNRLEYCIVNSTDLCSAECLETQDWKTKLNELVIKRSHAHTGIAEIDCFVDDNYLARYQGDGLLVCSPTGSTAYSMAAGGSIIHPEIDCLLLTSLNSMSLSSRPVVVPGDSLIRINSFKSDIFLEGREGGPIPGSKSVLVRKSKFPLRCFSRTNAGSDWVYDLGVRLSFERQVRVKPDHAVSLIKPIGLEK